MMTHCWIRVKCHLLCLFLALLASASAAHAEETPPLSYNDLPAHYRALFEPGRRFEYDLHGRIERSENMRMVAQHSSPGIFKCFVAEVYSGPSGLISEVKCNTDEIEDLTYVSPRELVEGRWYATAEGLWHESTGATPLSLEPINMIVAARPKTGRTESVSSETVLVRETKWSKGSWCTLHYDQSGDIQERERCFSVRGIGSAHDEWGGGVVARLTMKLRAAPSRGPQSHIEYAQLPAHYNALFEVGRQFTYDVELQNTYNNPTDAHCDAYGLVERVTPQGAAICFIAGVSSNGDQLRSTIECALPEAEDSRASAEYSIDGVWVATHQGLWQTSDVDHPLQISDRIMAPRPRSNRIEGPFGDGYESRGTEWINGAWCAHRYWLFGDANESKRCFTPEGISRASREWSGGSSWLVTMTQRKHTPPTCMH